MFTLACLVGCLNKLLVLAALPVGPLGNLRHDSALMGAITKTKGKQALPERVPVSHIPCTVLYRLHTCVWTLTMFGIVIYGW